LNGSLVSMSKVTLQDIEDALPCPDIDYEYEIERVSPMVHRVWLIHPQDKYLFKQDVRTVYCYLKGDKVHAPLSVKKMRPKSLCHISELHLQRWQTTIIPTQTSLRWMDK